MPVVVGDAPAVPDLVVTVDRYRQLTGDITTGDPDVLVALTDAQQLVEQDLRRPLSAVERTERCRILDGRVYPSATPLLATADGTIEGAAITVDRFWTWQAGPIWNTVDLDLYRVVTYTGGFTSGTLPVTIGREIARLARALLTVAGQDVPRVGEVNIEGEATLGSPAVTPVLTDTPPTVNSQALRPWRRRRSG